MSKKVTPAVKKVITKKVTTKKVSTKIAPALLPLVYADNKHSFWVTDGTILNSLVALAGALKDMKSSVYAHHVTGQKNDFADWVELVLSAPDCAKAMRKAKTAKTAHTAVTKCLKLYQV